MQHLISLKTSYIRPQINKHFFNNKQSTLMKRLISLLCMAIAIMAWQPPQLWAQTQPTGGDGSQESPFLITTAEELKWYADYVNGESGDGVVHNTACAKLMKNIDLSSVCGEGIGNWTPIGKYEIYQNNINIRYEGDFDGNGYTISNLYINDATGERLALFGQILSVAANKYSIHDLKMANVYVHGKNYCSAVCAYSERTLFENIEILSGDITASNNYASGISRAGAAKNCINRANITCGNMGAAGIIGWFLSGWTTASGYFIEKCRNYGKITSNLGQAGGICAETEQGNSTISDCANYGDIVIKGDIPNSMRYSVGGVFGKPWNIIIKNCVNFGNIYLKSASDNVGSVFGSGQLKRTYGIWANAGKIYINGIEQKDFPVFQSNLFWQNQHIDNATYINATKEQIESGYLAYLLQENCTEQIWGQNITNHPKDEFPLIGGTKIYTESTCTNGIPIQYNNEANIVKHNITHHTAMASTCTKTGNIEYWACAECGKQWSDEALTILVNKTVIPIQHSAKLEHKVTKAATCTEGGNHEYWYCNDCQTYFKEETCENAFSDDDDATTGVWIAMIPHAYTYTSNGNSTHDAICSVCQHEVHNENCLFGLDDQTCSKCLFALLDDITIEDEEVYARANTANVSNLTYNRTFKGTNWTTWYVPFELTLTPELCEKYAFSRINNVHQYDDNNDGTADRTIVESFKQTEGMTLKANYPYLVRALTDADKSMTLTLDDVTLCKAEDKSIECMSIDYVYTFSGTYQGVGESGTAADSPLSLFDYSDENKWYNFHSLPAQRHYLTITPRNGSTALHAPARILLQVIGEETSTGIVNLYNVEKRMTETYDLSGRRVNGNQRGLLIKNGKKVIVK